MADTSPQQPRRSAADKERSRQQSRAVSGKEAARGAGGRGQQQQPRAGAQRAKRGGTGGTRGRPGPRPAARGPRGAAPPGRRPPGRAGAQAGGSRSRLYTWGIVGLVVVIVGVFLIVHFTSSSAPTNVRAGNVTATVLADLNVATKVYNEVGIAKTISITAPTVVTNTKTLTFTGKPGIIFVGGEYCPFCAAERWSVITSLERFGTFSGLQTMASSSTDYAPNTQTFTFNKATYTSQYVATKLIEEFSNEKGPTGHYKQINTLTKTALAAVKNFDKSSSTASSGSIPFFSIGNKVVDTGASYSPLLLQGLTRQQIAADLKDPTNPITQSIIGTSNYLSAGVCSIDGGKPAKVCTSSGVKAAKTALKLTG